MLTEDTLNTPAHPMIQFEMDLGLPLFQIEPGSALARLLNAER